MSRVETQPTIIAVTQQTFNEISDKMAKQGCEDSFTLGTDNSITLDMGDIWLVPEPTPAEAIRKGLE